MVAGPYSHNTAMLQRSNAELAIPRRPYCRTCSAYNPADVERHEGRRLMRALISGAMFLPQTYRRSSLTMSWPRPSILRDRAERLGRPRSRRPESGCATDLSNRDRACRQARRRGAERHPGPRLHSRRTDKRTPGEETCAPECSHGDLRSGWWRGEAPRAGITPMATLNTCSRESRPFFRSNAVRCRVEVERPSYYSGRIVTPASLIERIARVIEPSTSMPRHALVTMLTWEACLTGVDRRKEDAEIGGEPAQV